MSRKVSRRRFLKDGASAALGLALVPLPRIQSAESFDLVIRSGTLLDGTGGPAWQADIGITGDSIAAIGSISPEQAKRVLDAAHLHVSPGFIDIHTHSDNTILRYPTADSRTQQGVTTEVTGNCGDSVAPLEGVGAEARRAELEERFDIQVPWTGVDGYFKALEEMRTSNNHALLLGHGVLRENAIGRENRPLNDVEMKGVLKAVEAGMEQGAFGLSTGLEYAPGLFTPTEELITLTRVVARRGGLYASHIRNEEAHLLEAVDEAIQIGRQTGARVEIAHLKASGRLNWGMQQAALNLIEAAKRQGVEVLADAYPYTAYSTTIRFFIPTWALEGGWTGLSKRLGEPSDRARIRDEVAGRVLRDPGDYSLIVISRLRTEKNQPLIGLSLTQIAAQWSVEPVDAVLRLLEEEEGSVSFIGHGMSPENVEKVLSHPLVMIGSDGSTMAPEGPAAKTKPHPRSYGTFPRVIGYYSRERKIFDLPTAVKKMTSMPADQIGLHDRGRLARGKKADIVIFNSDTIKDEATFEDPHQYPTGIQYVLVNGKLVVGQGEHTGARPGRVLRKS